MATSFSPLQSTLDIVGRSYKMSVEMTIKPPLVSDEARRIFLWITFGIVCQALVVFGTVTNIINIICFVKQGLKDSVNVSLLGLAISDLGSLVTLIFTNVCSFPPFLESDLPFEPTELQYLTTGWMHVMFSRITSWITALITLERCLCITMPLKVKHMFSPKRVAIIITAFAIVVVAGNAPVYYSSRFAMIFSPEKNKTILRLVYTEDRAIVDSVCFVISNVLIPFSALFLVIICTIMLVHELQKKAKWRKECTRPGKADTLSERDQRVAKMVVLISVLFIVCFAPSGVTFVVMATVPEVSMGGPYVNTLYVLAGVTLVLESTNSSMNIFIYYCMSSRYKSVFLQLFAKKRGSCHCGVGTVS